MEDLSKTVGEEIVGINFIPSGDDKVVRAKQLCAELIDIVVNNGPVNHYFDFTQHTIGEVLNAQMNVVQLLTLKLKKNEQQSMQKSNMIGEEKEAAESELVQCPSCKHEFEI